MNRSSEENEGGVEADCGGICKWSDGGLMLYWADYVRSIVTLKVPACT